MTDFVVLAVPTDDARTDEQTDLIETLLCDALAYMDDGMTDDEVRHCLHVAGEAIANATVNKVH